MFDRVLNMPLKTTTSTKVVLWYEHLHKVAKNSSPYDVYDYDGYFSLLNFADLLVSYKYFLFSTFSLTSVITAQKMKFSFKKLSKCEQKSRTL